MRSPRIITTILACGLSAAACGTDSSPTTPGSAPPLRTEMSPPGPEALVFRGNGQFFATWRGDGSLVEIGASAQSIAQLCRTGDFESGVLLDHFVERPSGGESVTFRSDGKVPLLLFPESAEDICSAPPVAQGELSAALGGRHARRPPEALRLRSGR